MREVRCCVGGVIAPVCGFIIAGTVCRNPARERHAAPRRHASPPAAPAITTRNQTRRPGDESHTQILVSDHALLNGIGLARVADVLPQHAAIGRLGHASYRGPDIGKSYGWALRI